MPGPIRSNQPPVTQPATTPVSTQDAGAKPQPKVQTQKAGTEVDKSTLQKHATGAKENATTKKTEATLQAQVKALQPKVTRELETRSILTSAKKSGLGDADLAKLKSNLEGIKDDARFKAESKFLKSHVLGTPNADRALRTYNGLSDMQSKNPKRLTDDVVHTLTRGVAEPKTRHATGKEGVLGQDGAMKAADALTKMSQKDYNLLNKSLQHAGLSRSGKPVAGGSRQTEKALILKAVGARDKEFTNPGIMNRMRNWVGKPSSHMSEVLNYAKDIRGDPRDTLIRQSTATDPYHGNRALQQRWNDSCGPTTTQGMKAELDPIYAKQLHKEFIHSTRTKGAIAKEQKQWLEAHGGVAVKRETAGGKGMSLSGLLDQQLTKFTGVKYPSTYTGGTVASRDAALNGVADKLQRGIDVPIRAGWPGGGGHFMFLTDVRGTGPNQKFLLTDPWEGKTVWLTRQQLASGNTPFPAGTGELTHTY